MAVARVLGLENIENVIELIVRGVRPPFSPSDFMKLIITTNQSFFGLNLAFNGVVSRLPLSHSFAPLHWCPAGTGICKSPYWQPQQQTFPSLSPMRPIASQWDQYQITYFIPLTHHHANSPLQMWTLFTKALARGNSTTQVSIMNTSTNFVITAILGLAIFSESLPPLWWVGAAMLVAGNVIIGRKDEGVSSSSAERVEDGREVQMGEVALPASGRAGEEEGEGLLRNRREGEGVEKDEDVPDLGSALEEM